MAPLLPSLGHRKMWPRACSRTGGNITVADEKCTMATDAVGVIASSALAGLAPVEPYGGGARSPETSVTDI